MKYQKLISNVLFVLLLSLFCHLNFCGAIEGKYDDLKLTFDGKLKEEVSVARNINLLNDDNDMDKIWYLQHTIDLNMNTSYGEERYGHEGIHTKVNIRNKARWGSPISVATTTKTGVKISDFVTSGHQHFIGKLILWIRELWIKISLNAIFNIESDSKHFITLGAFPFELGRGIALGDAFAVNPGLLGFYTEDAVDQYAFGGKISGDLVVDHLTYDIYGSIISTKADSFRNTTEKIRSIYLGECDFLPGRIYPFRGSGSVNYLVAARLNWTVFDTQDLGNVVIEPYALYNMDPEQRIEFDADANSKLGTAGLAVEWTGGRLEGGFDTAFNFGRQQVVAIDRNHVELKNDNSVSTFVYSHILDNDPNNADVKASKAKQTSANKNVVNDSSQDISNNGEKISSDPLLYNANDRFRSGYKNKYKGWMFISDVGYWFCPKILMLAATAGVASGDDSPNQNLEDPKDAEVDGEFKGFLGLQEVYNGKRVKSAFILGLRKTPRPLTSPIIGATTDQFALTVSEFTNLVIGGISAKWTPETEYKFMLNPNLLWFWQEHATKAFDLNNRQTTDQLASRFLGIEANIFAEILLVHEIKGTLVASVFFPGAHYDDIKGKPLNGAQSAFVDRLDPTGFTGDPEPLLGNDTSYALTAAIEYKF